VGRKKSKCAQIGGASEGKVEKEKKKKKLWTMSKSAPKKKKSGGKEERWNSGGFPKKW